MNRLMELGVALAANILMLTNLDELLLLLLLKVVLTAFCVFWIFTAVLASEDYSSYDPSHVIIQCNQTWRRTSWLENFIHSKPKLFLTSFLMSLYFHAWLLLLCGFILCCGGYYIYCYFSMKPVKKLARMSSLLERRLMSAESQVVELEKQLEAILKVKESRRDHECQKGKNENKELKEMTENVNTARDSQILNTTCHSEAYLPLGLKDHCPGWIRVIPRPIENYIVKNEDIMSIKSSGRRLVRRRSISARIFLMAQQSLREKN